MFSRWPRISRRPAVGGREALRERRARSSNWYLRLPLCSTTARPSAPGRLPVHQDRHQRVRHEREPEESRGRRSTGRPTSFPNISARSFESSGSEIQAVSRQRRRPAALGRTPRGRHGHGDVETNTSSRRTSPAPRPPARPRTGSRHRSSSHGMQRRPRKPLEQPRQDQVDRTSRTIPTATARSATRTAAGCTRAS